MTFQFEKKKYILLGTKFKANIGKFLVTDNGYCY